MVKPADVDVVDAGKKGASAGSPVMAACEEDVLLSVRGEGVERKLENVSRFPRHGWKVPLDHKFPEKRNQRIRPRIGQLPQLMPLFMR